MKKLLFLVYLCVFISEANAQDMNFEQTVKYINDKIACCSVYKETQLKASPNGAIQYTYFTKYNAAFNLFDLGSGDNLNIIENKNGIRLEGYPDDGSYQISFATNSRGGTFFCEFKVEADARRVYKALLHLKSLCSKEKDPFD